MNNYDGILLNPQNTILLIIDHQPQMYFAVKNNRRTDIINNIIALAKAAKIFQIPCILTTIEANTFSGNMISKITNIYPDYIPIDRTSINAWEDENVVNAVKNAGRKNIIMAGLWTEACVCFPALCAKADGYNVYACSDASGGFSHEAHNMAMQRMIQSGIVPITWQQAMLEFQRNWANKSTYDDVMNIIKEHSGVYGLGVEYMETMISQNK